MDGPSLQDSLEGHRETSERRLKNVPLSEQKDR